MQKADYHTHIISELISALESAKDNCTHAIHDEKDNNEDRNASSQDIDAIEFLLQEEGVTRDDLDKDFTTHYFSGACS